MSRCRRTADVIAAESGATPWSPRLRDHVLDCAQCSAVSGAGRSLEAALGRVTPSLVLEPLDAVELVGETWRRSAWSGMARAAGIAAVVMVATIGTVLAVERLADAAPAAPSTVRTLVLTAEDERVYALTACLRERGWEVADPNTEDGSGHVVPGFSTILQDPQDHDEFNADVIECSEGAGIPVDISE